MALPLALFDGINGSEVLIIGMLALMLFGSKRLPEVARTIGRALREVRRATSGIQDNLRDAMREDTPAPAVRPPPRQGPARTIAAPAVAAPPPAPAPSAEVEAPSPEAEDSPYAHLAHAEEGDPALRRSGSDEDIAR